MTAPKPSRSRAVRRDRQRGSAYLITLLALVVLTIIGLSLSVVTQTEMQIGANERTVQRIFYAADSGISVATARALNAFKYESIAYELRDADTPLALNLRQDIDISPFLPILSSPCNLCEINRAGQYGAQNYYRVNHAVTVVATRRGGPAETVLAQKTVSAMVDVMPWRPAPESFLPLSDPEQLKKIKF
jgi:Tfp pilus assembly protein PilX